MSLRAISVKVNNQNPARVGSVNYDSTISVKVNDQQDYKVKTVNLSANKLSNLSDVSAKNPHNDDVLIFNQETGNFETRQITISDINVNNIDAGTF